MNVYCGSIVSWLYPFLFRLGFPQKELHRVNIKPRFREWWGWFAYDWRGWFDYDWRGWCGYDWWRLWFFLRHGWRFFLR